MTFCGGKGKPANVSGRVVFVCMAFDRPIHSTAWDELKKNPGKKMMEFLVLGGRRKIHGTQKRCPKKEKQGPA
jgi:hypothetical protein